MIETIKMFDVGFGDCFVCSDPHAAMLVDCGGGVRGCASSVNAALLPFDDRYLMLTHFHDDHVGGVKYLHPRICFSEVYLPDFFDKSVIRVQFLALFLHSAQSENYKNALRLLTSVSGLLPHLQARSRISFLQKGQTVRNRLDTLRILLPDRNVAAEAGSLLQKSENFFHGNYGVAREEDLREYRRVLEDADAYFCILEELSEGEGKTVRVDRQGMEELGRIVASVVERVGQRKPPAETMSLKRQISALQNKLSLCFDNAAGAPDGKSVLFLGDATKKAVESLSREFRAPYFAIKVSHHGTRDYFTADLPESEYLLFSNGNSLRRGWEISMRYGEKYPERAFCCTDYRTACEYATVQKHCPAHRNPFTLCAPVGNPIILKIP